MCSKVLKFLVLLFPVFLPSQAFWWRSTSTEAPPPPPPLMKQIPLTYFRTYTYQQPMPQNQVQFPLLSSTDYITNFGALGNTPYLNPMMPVMPMGMPTNNEILVDVKPEKTYAGINLVRSLGNVMPAPPPPLITTTTPEPTTTTTTTTTTTPEPTTTTTTTTTTTEAPATDPPATVIPLIKTDSLVNIEASYPAFNRKVFTNHFNINYNRPVYPYPEYSVYKPNSPAANEENQLPPNIEFVPCMCPVNIQNAGFASPYGQGPQPLAGNPSNSIFLAQGRTNAEAEAIDLPISNMPLNLEVQAQVAAAAGEASNIVEDLQMVKLTDDEDTATESNLA